MYMEYMELSFKNLTHIITYNYDSDIFDFIEFNKFTDDESKTIYELIIKKDIEIFDHIETKYIYETYDNGQRDITKWFHDISIYVLGVEPIVFSDYIPSLLSIIHYNISERIKKLFGIAFVKCDTSVINVFSCKQLHNYEYNNIEYVQNILGQELFDCGIMNYPFVIDCFISRYLNIDIINRMSQEKIDKYISLCKKVLSINGNCICSISPILITNDLIEIALKQCPSAIYQLNLIKGCLNIINILQLKHYELSVLIISKNRYPKFSNLLKITQISNNIVPKYYLYKLYEIFRSLYVLPQLNLMEITANNDILIDAYELIQPF